MISFLKVKLCLKLSIFFKMLGFMIQLVALLWLTDENFALHYGTCNYKQRILPEKEYYIYNSEFPKLTKPGTACRWLVITDQPIKLTCEPFELPASDNCEQDALIIEEESASKSHRHCGHKPFSLISYSNGLNITLVTHNLSRGGKFLCSIETIPRDDDSKNCKCGWKNSSTIIDGETVGINEYPMMAGLVDTKKMIFLCGATIINKKQVLTAAHCVKTKKIEKLGVLIGDHDLTSVSETNATKSYRVASLEIHPWYDTDSHDYDLALVTIRGTILFNDKVGPVCLPFQHSPDTFAGNYVDVLGWKNVKVTDSPPKTLQKSKLSVITNAQCRITYRDVTNRQLCTYTEDKDVCQFFSGGPILWENPTTKNLVQIGITRLDHLCDVNKLEIDTRVGAFIDWITENTPEGITYCQSE